MKFTPVATLSTFAVLAAAQSPELPTCALACLGQAIITSDCDRGDDACFCQNFNALRAVVEECVGDDCTAEEIASMIRITVESCAELGQSVSVSAPIPTPSNFTPLPSFSSASDTAITTTGSGTSASDTTTDSVTTTETTESVSVSVSESTTTESETSATGSPTGSETETETESETATGSGSESETPTSDGSEGDDDNAAPRAQAAGWAVAGAALAALVL